MVGPWTDILGSQNGLYPRRNQVGRELVSWDCTGFPSIVLVGSVVDMDVVVVVVVVVIGIVFAHRIHAQHALGGSVGASQDIGWRCTPNWPIVLSAAAVVVVCFGVGIPLVGGNGPAIVGNAITLVRAEGSFLGSVLDVTSTRILVVLCLDIVVAAAASGGSVVVIIVVVVVVMVIEFLRTEFNGLYGSGLCWIVSIEFGQGIGQHPIVVAVQQIGITTHTTPMILDRYFQTSLTCLTTRQCGS